MNDTTNETKPDCAASRAGEAGADLTDVLAIPECCGETVSVNVSEYCCPVEYGSIAFCEHCGKEVEGSGTKPTRKAAEQSAIEQWKLSIANAAREAHERSAAE